MATVKEAMTAWGKRFIEEGSYDGYVVPDDAEITFTDDMESSGYCETCYYEEYVVRVSDGVRTSTFYGKITQLLEEMMREEV